MSRRKVEKKKRNERKGRDEQRRRSPRFSLSSSTSSSPHKKGENKQCKKATPSAGSMDPQDQGHRAARLGDHSTNDKQMDLQSTESRDDGGHAGHIHKDESWLPDKRILEQVLDTLQRRDTYEIFAEPVDPSEVEEYYEIIKEPMDFGTMRAKLHEGMYKTLQQFEHDVFLIFDNAMHFNSSATVYFRQARALEELAKRVFHVLRNDPKNFELEFPTTRRRSTRGIHSAEFKALNFGACPKVDRDLQSNTTSTNIGRRGCKRERRAFMSDIDRRSTYKPWSWTLLDEKCSTVSPIHHGERQLIHVNNGEEIGYQKSLMLFVKDLGPTAQRVAKRKLQELHTKIPSNPNKTRESPNEGSHKPLNQALGFSRFLDDDQTKTNTLGFSNFTLRNQGNNLVGKFDLNRQVQSVSSDSSPARIGCSSKDDHHFISNSGSFSSFPTHGQFTFDLPYLKSRMRELNDHVDHMSYYAFKMGSQSNVAWFG